MQPRVYSSYYDTQMANINYEITMKIDEINRCQEVVSRLQMYKPEDKIKPDVLDFVGNYTTIEIVSKEGFVQTAGDLLKKAFEAIFKAIKWIIEKLMELFRYLFDSEYRACKKALDLQRRVITLSTDQTLCNKFMNSTCDVIKKEDIDNIIFKTQYLVDMIANAAKMTDVQYSETLMQTLGANGGVSRGANNTVIDTLPSPAHLRSTTYQAAGWTIDGLNGTITSYISLLRGIEGLKDVGKKAETDARALKKKAEDAALSGAGADSVVNIQKETAVKITMTQVIGFTIAIASRRSENLLTFLNSLYERLHESK